MWFIYLFYKEMYTASLLVLHWYIFYSLFLLFFTFTSSMFIRSVVHHRQVDVTHNSNNSPFFHSLARFPWVKMYPSNERGDFPSFSLHISVQHVRLRSLFFVHHFSLYDYELSFFRSICDVNVCLVSICVLIYSWLFPYIVFCIKHGGIKSFQYFHTN